MKEKMDPFIIVCIFLFFCSLFFFTCVFISERQDRNNKANLIKEAIQKNWTPEQIKILLQVR